MIIQRVIQDSASSSASSPAIFSAMYKFNNTESSSHAEHSYPASNMLHIETNIQKQDFAFDTLLTMDPDGFTDLMAYQKSQNFFDMNSYMRPDWSAPSSTSSVYSSPMDCSRPIPEIMSNDQIISPTSSFPSHY